MVDEVSCGGVNLKVQVAGTCTGPPASIPVSVAAKENDHPQVKLICDARGHIEAKERAVRSALSLDEAIARMEIFDEGDDSTMKAGKAASPKSAKSRPFSFNHQTKHRRGSSGPLSTPILLRAASSNAWTRKLLFGKTSMARLISTKAVHRFLTEENGFSGDIADLEHALSDVSDSCDGDNGSNWWSPETVKRLLLSTTLNAAEDRQVYALRHDDMSHPLTDYFISTSHNTYLQGGQFRVTGAKVLVKAYEDALHRGCRCVELDVYDGSHGEPTITHISHHLAGGQCAVREVIARIAAVDRAINYATSTPLILNFENHIKTQSVRLAEILVENFGDKILRADDPTFGHEAIASGEGRLPSPSDLRGRVLCRGKVDRGGHTTPFELKNLMYLRNLSMPHLAPKSDAKSKEDKSATSPLQQIESPVASGIQDRPAWGTSSIKSHKMFKTIKSQRKELERRLRLPRLRRKKKHSAEEAEATSASDDAKKHRIISVPRFTSSWLTRTYPKATAVNSQNYDPVAMWLQGCQLVALNYQTPGTEMGVNQCMFRRNAGCGYVLKPKHLRDAQEAAFAGKCTELSLRVMSAVRIRSKSSLQSNSTDNSAKSGAYHQIKKSARKLHVQIKVLSLLHSEFSRYRTPASSIVQRPSVEMSTYGTTV